MSKRVWYLYLIAATLYVLVTFLVPTETATLQQYNLSEFKADLLKLTIVVPMLAIWFAAFYGYDKFKHYARAINGSKDGRAFNYIANGLGVFAISMPVTNILSGIFTYLLIDSPNLAATSVIVRNYLSILFPLVAFWFINKGSMELKNLSPRKNKQNRYSELVSMFTAALAVFYTFFIFQNPNRQIPAGPLWRATYYLPDWLILLTIILPYLYIWFIGFQSVLNISDYTRSVKGVLYKQMLGYLAKGITGIILISIVAQLLVNFASLFRSMALSPLLLIIYLLVAAIAVGYAYVAAGAKRLQKLEEV